MELRQLIYFTCIVRHRHFGRAAAELHVAQPSLSQQLRQLERELKVDLLERGKGTFRLTRAGEAFLARSQRILQEVDAAIREMADFRDAAIGEVRLGAVTYLPELNVGRLIAGFRASHSGVALKLVEVSTPQIVDALRGGRLDAALLGWFETNPLDGDIARETLFEDEIVAVVGKQHRLSGAGSTALADLRDEDLILPRAQSLLHSELTTRMRAAGIEPKVAFEVRDPHVGIQLASNHLGVQFLPRSLAQLHTSEIATVAIEPKICLSATLVWRELYCSRATQAFLDFVRARFS